MGKLLFLPGDTSLDIPVSRVLESAKETLTEGLVMGMDAEGLFFMSSSTGNVGKMLFWIECFKIQLLASALPE